MNPVLRSWRLAVGVVSLAFLLVLGAWSVRWLADARTRPARSSEASSETRLEDLYLPGDRPLTIQLRAVSADSGQFAMVPAVIRQSKNRMNQMKQAVLAFLDGSRQGKAMLPVPSRAVLNGLFLTPDGTAVVDLSVTPEPGFGFWEETLFVRGLIFVLSNHFPEVKRVRLLMDGQESGTLAGHYALGSPAGSYARNAMEAPAE